MTNPVTGITASTKRTPAAVSGRVTKPVTKLASVTLAFAPVPASPETVEKYKLQSPRKMFETGVMALADIVEGDILTYSGQDYNVRAVGTYPPIAYMALLLETVEA